MSSRRKKELLQIAEEKGWEYLSINEKLSEPFIREHKDLVNWNGISEYQNLSEPFIREHKDLVDWNWISIYQKLSEAFIREHKDLVNWDRISIYQKLSEPFIIEHKDLVNWYWISQCQKLSEAFIRKHKDLVNWNRISIYQKLSEPFIREHKDLVNWFRISQYQKLSEPFREEHDITIPEDNWLYASEEEKQKYIDNNLKDIYEQGSDKEGKYIIAYKATREDGYSMFNFQYQYEVGGIYESSCDCNLKEDISFGLSAWTKKKAMRYGGERCELYKVKIYVKDIGAIVHGGDKIRCFKQGIAEKV